MKSKERAMIKTLQALHHKLPPQIQNSIIKRDKLFRNRKKIQDQRHGGITECNVFIFRSHYALVVQIQL